MKILMDPIYSGRPSTCSSAFKCLKLAAYILDDLGRTDVFFYWIRPDWLSDEDREWFPEHPNIRYIDMLEFKDRMREYLRFPDALDVVEAFNGNFWDFDLLFTSRTSLTPFSRAVMTSPRQKKDGRLFKKIVCFEEMIVMDFRPTVAKSDVEAQELMTLTGYLASDVVFLQTDDEKREVLKAAKKYLSASSTKQLGQKIKLVTPMAFREIVPKAPEHRYRGGRPFCLSFTGRMESVSSNLDAVFSVMQTGFAMSKDPLKLLICTVTKTDHPMHIPPSAAEVRRASRDEFWKAAREEMDVMLVLHQNAEFSLSLVEPAMLGVPLIIIDQPWARSIYGRDYPFYVRNLAEAYAMVKLFKKDYEQYYARFEAWQQDVFRHMFKPGGKFGGDMFEETYRVLLDLEAFLNGGARTLYETRQGVHRLVGSLLATLPEGASEFVLFDLIGRVAKEQGLTILGQKIAPGDRDVRRLVFSTPWNELRTVLRFYGWVDASTTVGHFKKVTS